MDELIRNLAVYALPVIFAITQHGAAQAFAANYFGDNTAKAAGRLTFNPMNHIDPFGTIIVPALLYLATGFVFGYSKPVPIDYSRLRHPKRDMAWVALAGPGANFIMALLWLVFAAMLAFFQVQETFPHKVAQAGVLTNLLMFAYYLVPIPPLDGGRVLISILPHKMAYKFARIEPYGFFIVLALIWLKLLGFWVYPVMAVAQYALNLIASPLNLLLN
jgi:Zn-dependent protease